MKKIINYGIILVLIIILQFIWLQPMVNVLFIIASILSMASYLIYTFDKFDLKKLYKILIYVAIFIPFFIFMDVFAIMIVFPIIILINKVLNYYNKLENNKQFFICNIVLLAISIVVSLLAKEAFYNISNNPILSMMFIGIAILSCIYEANNIIKYNRFDVMDLIVIIISTIIMLSFSIYNINGFNEVISENNIVMEKIQNRTINTQTDLNNLVDDVINTVGIQRIQEFKTNMKQELIIFKGLKNTPVQLASMIKSLKEDNYLSFDEKKAWINKTELINIPTTINNNMCKPIITAIIMSDCIYVLGIVALFYKRKNNQFEY